MNKIKAFAVSNYGKIAGVVAGMGMLLTGVAHADVATTSDVTVAFSSLLNGLVLAIINVIVSFFTNNLPIIVVLGVCIGLVWYFIHKARAAGRGK
jgi:hypothetical protein